VSLTDKAIEQIRTGALPPGSRLPPEPDLAAQLGLSRNLAREAVKALAVARVLEVRRGDGTYVTSLQPSLLLEGLGVRWSCSKVTRSPLRTSWKYGGSSNRWLRPLPPPGSPTPPSWPK
jgi:DNA-binding FadR family transcriptional regulator